MTQLVKPDDLYAILNRLEALQQQMSDERYNAGLSARSGGTSLPTAPVHGQVFDYLADATNGIEWSFRYRAFMADGVTPNPSAFKWDFIGGGWLRVDAVTANNTYTATGYTNSPTIPQIVLPLAGDYLIEFGNGYCGPNANTEYDCGVKVGATAPAQPLVATLVAGAGGNARATIGRRARKTNIAAGTTITHQFSGTGGGACDHPFIAARPTRVG